MAPKVARTGQRKTKAASAAGTEASSPSSSPADLPSVGANQPIRMVNTNDVSFALKSITVDTNLTTNSNYPVHPGASSVTSVGDDVSTATTPSIYNSNSMSDAIPGQNGPSDFIYAVPHPIQTHLIAQGGSANSISNRPPPKQQRKKREDDFDRSDFTKPLPINQKIFCYYPLTGKYHGALVIDRRKLDDNGLVIPDPELEEYLKKRPKNSRKKATKKTDKNAAAEKEDEDDGTAPGSGNYGASGPGLGSGSHASVYYDPDLVYEPPPEWFDKHNYLYYVHFVEWDRRMDDWVSRDRLRLIEFLGDEHIAMPALPAHEPDPTEPLFPAPKDPFPKISTRDPRLTRWEKILDAVHEAHQGGHGAFTADDIAAHEEATKTKNIATVVLGKYSLDTWYYSPFPSEYNVFSKLYLCEFCLSFFGYESELERHSRRCMMRHPPGNEIYRSKEQNVEVAVFEVDGAKEQSYCENLCYLSKLFLDHKTLEFDCSPFLFYVLCEVDARGYHMVGYFSKEKVSVARYNLACILTLPCHQRKGYGKFLISLSYELSKAEKKVGSPEKPISDLGKVSYVSYWSSTLLSIFASTLGYSGDTAKQQQQVGLSGSTTEGFSLDELSQYTCIEIVDIEETLKSMQVLVFYREGWVFSKSMIQQLLDQKEEAKRIRDSKPKDPNAIFVAQCRAHLLHWTPFFSRPTDAQAALDSGMGGGGYGVGRSRRGEQSQDKD